MSVKDEAFWAALKAQLEEQQRQYPVRGKAFRRRARALYNAKAWVNPSMSSETLAWALRGIGVPMDQLVAIHTLIYG